MAANGDGEMRLGEKEEEEAVLVAPISQFLTTSNIRRRSGAISGGLYLWVDGTMKFAILDLYGLDTYLVQIRLPVPLI